jgi:hypothetical protein
MGMSPAGLRHLYLPLNCWKARIFGRQNCRTDVEMIEEVLWTAFEEQHRCLGAVFTLALSQTSVAASKKPMKQGAILRSCSIFVAIVS